jgi:hypothetical protein
MVPYAPTLNKLLFSGPLRCYAWKKELFYIYTFFFLNDLFLYLAIDTVFHPSGIIQNRISRFAGFISAMLLWGRVEKTNKSELRNRLTYRVLIYIFEVGMKTFFLKWEISRSKSQFEKKNWKNGLFLFFWGWRLNFFWAHVEP